MADTVVAELEARWGPVASWRRYRPQRQPVKPPKRHAPDTPTRQLPLWARVPDDLPF